MYSYKRAKQNLDKIKKIAKRNHKRITIKLKDKNVSQLTKMQKMLIDVNKNDRDRFEYK